MEFDGRTLDLHRIPEDPTLQAWDQADLYALETLRSEGIGGPVLLVLDAFGALACALEGHERVSAGDSELARLALIANAGHNATSPVPWTSLDSIEGEFAAAIVKVPREKELLVAALARIRPHLRADALVIGAGMTKHVHNATISGFEKWIGPTITTPARSRARLLLARAQSPLHTVPGATPVEVAGERFTLWQEPGVFAQRGVDAGSALLLPWVPRLAEEGRHQVIADAGCGSGLLATAAAVRNPRASVVATDTSYLAVGSATRTFAEAGLAHAQARVDNVLATCADGSVDLVLSNPPQHQAAALSQELLAAFIADAHRVLRPTGHVRMVANRHVNLNRALGEYFERVRILDQDRRFMVCEAATPVSGRTRTP